MGIQLTSNQPINIKIINNKYNRVGTKKLKNHKDKKQVKNYYFT